MLEVEQALNAWENLHKGVGCYLCVPRPANNEYRLEIAQLSISTLYLFRDQRFRGYSLLIFDAQHATSLEQLDEAEYGAYMLDLRSAATAIRHAFNPDHLNYECLGNSTPHLHWHIVPRYKNDPRWGQPIWEGWPRNEFNLNRVIVSDQEYQDMIARIQSWLSLFLK